MDVLFVVMPFADVSRPALGVSLLKSGIRGLGFESRVVYFNFLLAEMIGQTLYTRLVDGLGSNTLVGEWFFADAVFDPDTLPPETQYLTKILSSFCPGADPIFGQLTQARKRRGEFLDRVVEQILAVSPKVVGFTTTFHQTCACLAVAKRLKAMAHPPVIVFGGANCEDEMGLQLLRSFPDLDYVCSGEADVSFPLLLQQLLRGELASEIPGVMRQGVTTAVTVAKPVTDMDKLAYPDFEDFFERLAESPLRTELEVSLTCETSRGCWWGAKSHCTFCGLNGGTMMFRSKSQKRALAEFSHLTRTYNVKRVSCVDNILDMKYVPGLFQQIKEAGLGLDLFFEVKANLKRDQLKALREGGVTAIQPGIESLSDEVLRLMRKGCNALQNIQFLRNCAEVGIHAAWNMLAGFPGESRSEYQRMAEVVPALTHLTPPNICTAIRLDRFSPYFGRSNDYGMVKIRPARAYYYAFPLTGGELARLAYYFDFDYEDQRQPLDYLGELQFEINQWISAHVRQDKPRPKLEAATADSGIEITDTREIAVAEKHRLEELAADIYVLCETPLTMEGLCRELGPETDAEVVGPALGELVNAKLMLQSGPYFLSLAVFPNRPQKSCLFRSPCRS